MERIDPESPRVDPDPDAHPKPKPYTDEEWAETEGAQRWVGPSGQEYDYDPREAYEPGDPKGLGPSGYW